MSTALSPAHRELAQLLWSKRFARYERTVLASGKISDFYFDGKQAMLHHGTAALIPSLFRQVLGDDRPDYIIGEGVGGALAVGMMLASDAKNPHGIPGLVIEEGQLLGFPHNDNMRGLNIGIVEDTVTTGGSVMNKVVPILHAHEATITKIYALMDREEGGRETFAKAGIPFDSMFTRTTLESARQ